MVTPEWPPMTGTTVVSAAEPGTRPEVNWEARTTSRVVIPKSLLGSKVPAFLKTEPTIGTVLQTASAHVRLVLS